MSKHSGLSHIVVNAMEKNKRGEVMVPVLRGLESHQYLKVKDRGNSTWQESRGGSVCDTTKEEEYKDGLEIY